MQVMEGQPFWRMYTKFTPCQIVLSALQELFDLVLFGQVFTLEKGALTFD